MSELDSDGSMPLAAATNLLGSFPMLLEASTGLFLLNNMVNSAWAKARVDVQRKTAGEVIE